MTSGDDIDFDTLAFGSAVALGRAQYRAEHGDTHAQTVLAQVSSAYAHAALDTATPADDRRAAT